MDIKPPQPGGEGSKTSQSTGTSSNTSLLGTQLEPRHQSIHRNSANEATKNMRQDAHLQILCQTRSCKNMKHRAIGCDYIHTMANGHQLTVQCTVSVGRELPVQCITAHNGKPPSSTRAFVHTLREIEQDDVVSSGIFVDELRVMHLVSATGPVNPPAVQVWMEKTDRFGSRTIQKPDQQLLEGPNPAPHPSARGFGQVWLDPSGPISGFAFQVVQFMVAFRYLTVTSKIFTMVCRCSFWMNRPPCGSQYVDKRSLHHPGNERQQSVNDFRSCLLGNQSRHWLQLVITEVLAFFISKSRSDTLRAPSWKWASNEHQQCKVTHIG